LAGPANMQIFKIKRQCQGCLRPLGNAFVEKRSLSAPSSNIVTGLKVKYSTLFNTAGPTTGDGF
jgi:hypothetical protein